MKKIPSYIWMILSILVLICFGFSSYHYGFFPEQVSIGPNNTLIVQHPFNFLSPCLIMIIINIVVDILLIILSHKKKITDTNLYMVSILMFILSVFIGLGTNLYI